MQGGNIEPLHHITRSKQCTKRHIHEPHSTQHEHTRCLSHTRTRSVYNIQHTETHTTRYTQPHTTLAQRHLFPFSIHTLPTLPPPLPSTYSLPTLPPAYLYSPAILCHPSPLHLLSLSLPLPSPVWYFPPLPALFTPSAPVLRPLWLVCGLRPWLPLPVPAAPLVLPASASPLPSLPSAPSPAPPPPATRSSTRPWPA